MPNNNETIELPRGIAEAETETTPTPKPTRAESSRINGSKSRGPITPEGKSTSAKNALRHGEYAKNLTLKYEDDQAWIRTLAALESHFNPQTDLEASLILTMAHARWRTLRIWSIEKAVLDQAIDTACAQRQPPSDPDAPNANIITEAQLMPLVANATRHLTDTSGVLRMIDRAENRYQRIFSRTLNELRKLRAERHSESEQQANNDLKNPGVVKNEQTNPGNPAKSTIPDPAGPPCTAPPPPHPASFEVQYRHLVPIGARIRESASRIPSKPGPAQHTEDKMEQK